jgi:hypothetical protein
MARFIRHLSLFSLVCGLSFLYIYSLADGRTDPFYLKFTSSKQKSLIIGSSRAAQGLQPRIMNLYFEDKSLYNFSFSRIHSPYDKAYYKAIIDKIEPNTNDGLFVVCVNPWTISDFNNRTGENPIQKKISFLETTKYVNTKPNFSYLISSFEHRNIEIISNKLDASKNLVHDDGWFQVHIEESDISIQKRTDQTVKSYKRITEQYNGISDEKMYYLIKLVEYLKKKGEVYLVRLPINSQMLLIEEEYCSSFDTIIKKISDKTNVEYINFMSYRDLFQYTDGHHLNIESGEKLSKELSIRIKDLQTQSNTF